MRRLVNKQYLTGLCQVTSVCTCIYNNAPITVYELKHDYYRIICHLHTCYRSGKHY